jgi:hypothetical protein
MQLQAKNSPSEMHLYERNILMGHELFYAMKRNFGEGRKVIKFLIQASLKMFW